MQRRRTVLKQGSVLALLAACDALVVAAEAPADAPSPFDAKTLADALARLGGTPLDSRDVTITAPEIAENGAVVPVAVTSAVPNTESIYLLVEKNPFPLAAAFAIPAGTEPFVSTRVKMSESTRLVAVVRAGGQLHATSRDTKVTLGGCGG